MTSVFSVVHWFVWRNPQRRAANLLRFAEVEADGGRDLVRAAETTADPVLRRLFLKHALDEQRHAGLFRERGVALMRETHGSAGHAPQWLAPGERGLDDLRVERESDASLLAFLHLSERTAARDFANYVAVLGCDPSTRETFAKVLHDEAYHMTYTRKELRRLSPDGGRRRIWQARGRRLWKAYLRAAAALTSVMGGLILGLQFYVLLPPFALAMKRAARREKLGWTTIEADRQGSLGSAY